MIDTKVSVVGLALKSGERVDFDQLGGRYDQRSRSFSGTTAAGDQVTIPLSFVEMVEVEALAAGRTKVAAYSVEAFLQYEERKPTEKIVGAVLLSGDVVSFNHLGPRIDYESNSLIGQTTLGERVILPLDNVLYLQVRKFDAGKTLVATFGIIALTTGTLFAIAVATKESCPFIYSFNGEQYVLDAEPLGGAVCRGLKRADLSRLEHLAPVDGEYRILINNEVGETQYLDEVRLLVIDHDPALTVIPDSVGNLYYIGSPVAPSSAFDEDGRDLTGFVGARDDVFWQTKMPTDSVRFENLQHTLTFTFPKPPDADSVMLLFNGGTTFWGSNMVRELLLLYGHEVDDWYREVEAGGPALAEMFGFLQREQIYLLKIGVWQGESWVGHGYLQPGGPFITEDRILPLDISDVTGDSLMIRLTPPVG